jgi:hypothetical protein
LLNVTELVTLPADVAEVAEVAEVADVAVAALPVILIPQVPEAFVPVIDGAPMVLYEIVRAALPSKVLPDVAPAPPLLKVTALATALALAAVEALVAEVAVDALPEILIAQVPVAPDPEVDGAPIVL